ncbi:LysR family transcriptional regulator [Bdellovibrio sp. 22V]|uniref:LysR family transcriptional regulator n=1 Tax=Bdellovibrio TaxID=958 RepID=UPI002543A5DC|nr:LysR family transcriptional regulator [Bdellovibrio sp. 22V]WII71290.1 LysR family transcriptional regulator [Bdellovibrio sp. 22V]
MEQLDLNQIRTFVRLVQAGSFTRAAEVLRQPKSRVSRRLAALEKELGVQLIYRTTRQFQLTETGRAFYERAQGLVEGLESLTNEVSESTAEVSGLIKITASDDMGVRHLPPILDEFTKLYPRVRFEILLTQAVVDLVKESVDVAIRAGHLKDSSLRVRKIGTIGNIFVASPGFLERYRHWEDLSQFSSLPFLGMTQKLDVWKSPEGKKVQLKTNPIFTVNNPSALVELALLGKGVGFIPEFLCSAHIKAGRLVHIYKNLKGAEVPLSIVMPEQKEVPLKIKKFTEFAAKKLKDMVWAET